MADATDIGLNGINTRLNVRGEGGFGADVALDAVALICSYGLNDDEDGDSLDIGITVWTLLTFRGYTV